MKEPIQDQQDFSNSSDNDFENGARRRKPKPFPEGLSKLSRREFLALSGETIAALTLLASCAPESTATPTVTAPSPTATLAEPAPSPTPRMPLSTPTRMPEDLDLKIGQMLMVGFRGLELRSDNPIVQDIRERHLGGVFLFDNDVAADSSVRNIQSPQQVKALTAALQKIAAVPLLIGIDQEGGKVVRLKETFGFAPTVSEQYLGTLNQLDTTRAYAETAAKTLAQAGINLNLAPVVDLNTNPNNPVIGKLERSFSADPIVVTKHAMEVIDAHHRQAVLCTLKHFPGHGSSTSDSHLGFVDVTNTWSSKELDPFENLMKAERADVVMTAHIFNSKLDPDLPATLSKPIITDILRRNLGYDGVVISDDMQMGAITQFYGLETALQKTIEAGVDIISFANNLVYEPDIVARAIAIIKRLVLKGTIDVDRIDQSYQRISRLKKRLA